MTIKCPYCGAVYDIEENECGCRVRCEVCGKRFVIGHAPSSGKNLQPGPQKSNLPALTTDDDKEQKKKSSWEGVGVFIVACVMVCRAIFGCDGKKSEKHEDVPSQTSSEYDSDRWSRSADKKLGKTSIPQKSLNAQRWQHDEKDTDDIVTEADLIVQKRQREDAILAEKVKVAKNKEKQYLDVFLAELKRNGGDKQAAQRVAESRVELDLTGTYDAAKLMAKEKGDPSILRDLEAAFEKQTGLKIDLETEEDEEDEDILTRALAYVEKRYQQRLRRYGLTEADLHAETSGIPRNVVRQLFEDRARIKAYKRELLIR